MNEVKHTPGPWKILKTAKPMTITGNIHQITDQDRYPSAFVPAWDNPAPGEEDGTNEALANARLIAAAPEMLEALQEARTQVAILQDRLGIKDTGAGTLSIIDAAIAKATGSAK